ncbi:MAG: hypothetical protein ACTSU5_13805 [Promethearchaeota archaeon]
MPPNQDPEEGIASDDSDATISDEEIVAMALAATGTPAEPASIASFTISPEQVETLDMVVEMWKDIQVDVTNTKESVEALVRSFEGKAGNIAGLVATAKEFYDNCPKYSSADEYKKNIMKKVDESEEEKQQRERGKNLLGAFSKPLD